MKRYDFQCHRDHLGSYAAPYEMPDGAYVRHSDAQAEIERQREDLEETIRAMGDHNELVSKECCRLRVALENIIDTVNTASTAGYPGKFDGRIMTIAHDALYPPEQSTEGGAV